MPGVLSGLQRGVALALPGCDYYDPANFELERRAGEPAVGFGVPSGGGPGGPYGRGPDPSPAAIARLSGDTCQPGSLGMSLPVITPASN